MKYTEPIPLRISKEQHTALKKLAEQSEKETASIIKSSIEKVRNISLTDFLLMMLLLK